MNEGIAERLLDRASIGDLVGYATALTSIPVNQLNTIGKETAFQQSVARLVPIALKAPKKLDRLTALALIGRADNTTQQKQEPVAAAAKAAVAIPPPHLDAEAQDSLKPEDRFYIAIVVARGDPAWRMPYAAHALVNEGGEPKKQNDVRSAFAALVFEEAPTLADAFRTIAEAVPGSLHEDPGTKDPNLSRARRLSKLLPAIEDSVRRTLVDSGDGLTEEFNAMTHALVFRYSRPIIGMEGDVTAASAAETVLMLLGTLLRTRFSISVETEAYKAVGRLKYWHKTESWPKAAALARKRLNQTLMEAISIRASVGKASRELLAVLVQLTGNRRKVEAQLAELAERPDISPVVQDWLRAGGRQPPPRFETVASEEAGLRDVDALIAATAVRALHVQSLIENDAKDALSKFRECDELNEHALRLNQTFNFARALATDAVAIATRRSMTFVGIAGEKVLAEPKRHRVRDGRMIETERVQIETPGVERVLPNGTVEVVLPAIVVPVESKRK